MHKVVTTFLLILLAFTGCVQPEANNDTTPKWIMNPNQNGKVGAIGAAYRHHKGFTYQRKLAISRALDELALQQGVKVSLNMRKEEQMRNDKVKSNLDVSSIYTTNSNSNTITAHIEETWQDKSTQEFFVWLVID